MSIIDSIYTVYRMVNSFSKSYTNIGRSKDKGHSTKSGNSRKAIRARHKKNKNKKTHRKNKNKKHKK